MKINKLTGYCKEEQLKEFHETQERNFGFFFLQVYPEKEFDDDVKVELIVKHGE